MINRRTILFVVSVVVLVGSLFSIGRMLFRGKPSVKLGPYEAIGIKVAEQTAGLLGQKGRVLVIAGELDSPIIGAEVKAFQKTLRKHSGLSVVAVESVAIDPLRPREFVALFKKHTGVDAVVSFYGFPEFNEPELAQLSRPLPKIVAVLNGIEGAKQLFASGADGLVIVAAAPTKPRNPREPFALEIIPARPGRQ